MDIGNGSSGTSIESTQPIKIFYCYARKDKRFRDMLEKYLSTMKRSNWVSSWHDGMIEAGEDWERKIDEQIKAANVIFLLISPDFMASDYCYGVEMKCALERHKAKKACVIPIILRPTDWEDAPFARLQVLPTNAKPLARWQDRDEAFLDIARGIRKAVGKLLISQRTVDQWREEGRRLIHLEKFEDALAAFDHAIELAPYNAWAYSDKGTTFVNLGHYEEALQLYKQAIDVALKSIGGIKEDAIFEKFSVSGGLETKVALASFFMKAGEVLLFLNRPEESIAFFNQVMDLGPYNRCYFGRGLAFMKLQRYEEALSDFEQAIDLYPYEEEVYLYYTNKGHALSSLGRFEDALSAYKQAFTLNPDYPEAYTSKGVLLGKLKRFKEALVLLERATQLDPNAVDAYNGIADCYYELKDYEAALAAYQHVIKLDDNNYHALCLRGNTLSKLGRDEEAVKAFDEAIRVNPHDPRAYRRKADILADLGHDFESQTISSYAERIDTRYDAVKWTLLLDISDPEKLLDSCEQEIQKDPQNITAFLCKCVALSRLNLHQEAFDLYTDLLQNYPDLERGAVGSILRSFRLKLEMRLNNHNNLEAEQPLEQVGEDMQSDEFEHED